MVQAMAMRLPTAPTTVWQWTVRPATQMVARTLSILPHTLPPRTARQGRPRRAPEIAIRASPSVSDAECHVRFDAAFSRV